LRNWHCYFAATISVALITGNTDNYTPLLRYNYRMLSNTQRCAMTESTAPPRLLVHRDARCRLVSNATFRSGKVYSNLMEFNRKGKGGKSSEGLLSSQLISRIPNLGVFSLAGAGGEGRRSVRKSQGQRVEFSRAVCNRARNSRRKSDAGKAKKRAAPPGSRPRWPRVVSRCS